MNFDHSINYFVMTRRTLGHAVCLGLRVIERSPASRNKNHFIMAPISRQLISGRTNLRSQRNNLTVRGILFASASLLAIIAITFTSSDVLAQATAPDTMSNVTWPHTFTFGVGAGGNDNWQMSGVAGTGDPADPFGDYGYTQSHAEFEPEFHIMAEIPIGDRWMFAPRIEYNNYSLGWNAASTISPAGGVNQPLTTSIQDIGADLLVKYSFSNLHVMGGANLSTPIAALTYAHSTTSDATNTLPNYAKFLAAIKAGVGYDIPLNSSYTIWLTPEGFFTLPLISYQQTHNGMNLFPATLTGGATLKFALGGAPPPAPPPPIQIAATITAHGVMPDGSRVADPVSPQEATHLRSSMPLLPYVFFDYNSAVISSRYNRDGATGFSEESALDGKDALAANHDVLDVVGLRMKNNPTMTVKLIGTNSNSKEERDNIELSKARATAVADYLENTWAISPSRVMIDERNLPEIPTNPVTKAGMEENRRVEIVSNDADLTAPVKLDKKESQSVGETEISYDMTVTPDPSAHTYKSWTIALDKDGVPIGNPISGTGAPPSSTTEQIPNAQNYLGQPVHYTLTVTDADGQTAHADGLTRIEAKTVDHNTFEKYSMLSFDFDRSDINARARQMLQLISESISASATGVKIEGYCDSTGSREYNQALSEARANAAASALRSSTSLPANVTIQGHGLNDPKFPNDLPEGRQLNRRVEFTIQKAS